MTGETSNHGPGAGSGFPTWVFIVTGLAGFMAMLDNLVVMMALPAISEDLGGGIDNLEWTVSAYTLTFAVLLMLGAAMGDRFGRRRMFIGGLALFTAASAAAALSPGIDALVAFRAAQGVGAALLMPLTLTLLMAAVGPKYRGAVLGAWGAINGLAIASGPLIGGLLVQHISWHWIFWLNVPIGVLLIPLARWKVSESHGPNNRLDVVGTIIVSLGFLGIVFGLIRGNADGWSSPLIVSSIAAGGVLLAAFVWWEMKVDEPMLPMRLFRNRTFSAVNLTSLLMALGMFGAIFLLTQFLQTVQGYSPVEAGVRLLPWTGTPILVAPIAGILSDRVGGRPLIVLGLFLQAIGLGWWALVAEPDVSYLTQLAPMILSGTGMSLFYAPVANVLMQSVRTVEQGVASGSNNALREVGGALGIAVLAAIFAGQGSYDSPQRFVDGLVPALWAGTGVLALGGIAMCFARRHPAPETSRPGGDPAGEGAARTDPVVKAV
ncbi:DHA2 family efflux MFS transporter permease subunit [Streptomyces albireticuli]|uniref:DHA2 family efflux MFS transporter permease subunit n=1 Tax=Streptomyces albireticuli TaxID=1940 RepID=UPI000B434CE8|nr:DHA2 family efflux MFS transporter permease subunit [Streptomyces albireticuli]